MEKLWCEIDLNKIRNNVKLIRKKTEKKILAVVKCDAYGLGIEEVSSALDEVVDGFVVDDIDEATKVESDKPILILLPIIHDEDLEHIKDNFILTIDSPSTLEKLKDRPYTIHIFVDSGMCRFGIQPTKLDGLIQKIENEYPNITVDGIYTHLNHPSNIKYTKEQISNFKQVVDKHLHKIPRIHLLNSTGLLKHNNTDFDNHIRIGNLLYGYEGGEYGFERAFSYKARLLTSTKIGKSQYVGYGNRYKTRKETCIGVLGVGTIHGFNCSKNTKSSMFYDLIRTIYHHIKNEPLIFYNERPVKILGGSSMNFTQVDLGNLKVDKHSPFDIKLSSIIADSSITKKYIY